MPARWSASSVMGDQSNTLYFSTWLYFLSFILWTTNQSFCLSTSYSMCSVIIDLYLVLYYTLMACDCTNCGRHMWEVFTCTCWVRTVFLISIPIPCTFCWYWMTLIPKPQPPFEIKGGKPTVISVKNIYRKRNKAWDRRRDPKSQGSNFYWLQ